MATLKITHNGLLAILLALGLSGCTIVRGGADFMFGQTNPYVDPSIERNLPKTFFGDANGDLDEKAKHQKVESALETQEEFGNNFWESGPDLPDPSNSCLNDYCITNIESGLLGKGTEKYTLYVDHPYYVSLMNVVKNCESNSPPLVLDTRITEALISVATAKCKTARSRLAEIYLSVSDRACSSRLASIGAGQASTNFLLRFTNITSSAVATFAGVASTARWLSALSLASSETGALFDDEVFGRALNYAMAKQITEKRQATREKIGAGLKLGILDYSLDQLLGDLRLYNQQCSYTYGQQLVTDAVNGAEQPMSEQYGAYLTTLRGEKEDAVARKTELNKQIAELKSQLELAPNDSEKQARLTAAKNSLLEDQHLIDRLDNEIRDAQLSLIQYGRP